MNYQVVQVLKLSLDFMILETNVLFDWLEFLLYTNKGAKE